MGSPILSPWTLQIRALVVTQVRDSNSFTLDTTDTGTGGDTGSGDSNTFTLDTTDTGTGGDTGSGDSNTFTLDTTDTGTGGDTGSGIPILSL